MSAYSFYTSAHDATSDEVMSLVATYKMITDPSSHSAIDWIRRCYANGDLEEAYAAKRSLPAVTFGGVFARRRVSEITTYSRHVVIDIDGLETTEEAFEIRDAFKDVAIMGFISPSGLGVKLVFSTTVEDPLDHLSAWAAARDVVLSRYPDIDVDKSGKDVTRLCFISYDASAWLELNDPLQVELLPRPQKVAKSATSGSLEPVVTNRHEWITHFAARLARAVGADVPPEALVAWSSQAWMARVAGREPGPGEIQRAVEGALRKFDLLPTVQDDLEFLRVGREAAEAITSRGIDSPEYDEDDLSDQAAPEEPWPEHLLNWPGWIGRIVDDMEPSAAIYQRPLALATTLPIWGSLVGRLVCSPTDLRTNIYSVGLCPTGGGKEAPRRYWKQVLHMAGAMDHLHPELIASESAVYASVSNKVSATFLIDEIGRMLQAINGKGASNHEAGILTALLSLYAQANGVFTGKAFADPTKRPVDPIVQPCVGVAATGNPEDFWTAFTSSDVSNGFLPRLLIFPTPGGLPNAKVPEPLNPHPEIVDAVQRWGQSRSALQDRSWPEPVRIPYSTGVEAQWSAWSKDLHTRRQRASDRVEGDLLSRLWENANRLALLAATSEDVPENRQGMRITSDHSQLAIEVAEWVHRQTLGQIRRHVSDSEYQKSLKSILAWIEESASKGRSYRAIVRKMQHMPRTVRDDILSALEEGGQVLREPRGRVMVLVHRRYGTHVSDTPTEDGGESGMYFGNDE